MPRSCSSAAAAGAAGPPPRPSPRPAIGGATMWPRASRATPMPSAIAARQAAGRPRDCPGSRTEGMAMSEEVARFPGVDSVLAGQWAQVRGRLRSEFGEATYRSWLKPLTLLGQSDCQVSIAVKTRFMRDWISQHYAERIRALWHAANPEIRGIEFIVDGSRPQ